MKIQWTGKASLDLVRLSEHLRPVAPDAAVSVIQQLARAPDRLPDYPRIGEKLDAYAPREVRRIIVGNYELRYEIAAKSAVSGRRNRRLRLIPNARRKKNRVINSTAFYHR